MITSQTLIPKTVGVVKQPQGRQLLPYTTLKWRQDKLLVRSSQSAKQPHLPALENQQWLIICLKHSPVKLVSLDPKLGETELKFWADACEQAGKKVFLWIPSNPQLPRNCRPVTWFLKRILDWIIALVWLLILSPVMLGLALLIHFSSSGPIFFQQWRVGKRGQLFRIIKFRTMVVDPEKLHHQVKSDIPGLHKREDDPRFTPLGRWMRKYSIDELPQLVNVLRGEMSLVGPHPWAFYDVVRLSREGQRRLNARPGITGIRQAKARAHLLDIEVVNTLDIEYLSDWSLRQDLKLLLTTVPKFLSRFGAY